MPSYCSDGNKKKRTASSSLRCRKQVSTPVMSIAAECSSSIEVRHCKKVVQRVYGGAMPNEMPRPLNRWERNPAAGGIPASGGIPTVRGAPTASCTHTPTAGGILSTGAGGTAVSEDGIVESKQKRLHYDDTMQQYAATSTHAEDANGQEAAASVAVGNSMVPAQSQQCSPTSTNVDEFCSWMENCVDQNADELEIEKHYQCLQYVKDLCKRHQLQNRSYRVDRNDLNLASAAASSPGQFAESNGYRENYVIAQSASDEFGINSAPATSMDHNHENTVRKSKFVCMDKLRTCVKFNETDQICEVDYTADIGGESASPSSETFNTNQGFDELQDLHLSGGNRDYSGPHYKRDQGGGYVMQKDESYESTRNLDHHAMEKCGEKAPIFQSDQNKDNSRSYMPEGYIQYQEKTFQDANTAYHSDNTEAHCSGACSKTVKRVADKHENDRQFDDFEDNSEYREYSGNQQYRLDKSTLANSKCVKRCDYGNWPLQKSHRPDGGSNDFDRANGYGSENEENFDRFVTPGPDLASIGSSCRNMHNYCCLPNGGKIDNQTLCQSSHCIVVRRNMDFRADEEMPSPILGQTVEEDRYSNGNEAELQIDSSSMNGNYSDLSRPRGGLASQQNGRVGVDNSHGRDHGIDHGRDQGNQDDSMLNSTSELPHYDTECSYMNIDEAMDQYDMLLDESQRESSGYADTPTAPLTPCPSQTLSQSPSRIHVEASQKYDQYSVASMYSGNQDELQDRRIQQHASAGRYHKCGTENNGRVEYCRSNPNDSHELMNSPQDIVVGANPCPSRVHVERYHGSGGNYEPHVKEGNLNADRRSMKSNDTYEMTANHSSNPLDQDYKRFDQYCGLSTNSIHDLMTQNTRDDSYNTYVAESKFNINPIPSQSVSQITTELTPNLSVAPSIAENKAVPQTYESYNQYANHVGGQEQIREPTAYNALRGDNISRTVGPNENTKNMQYPSRLSLLSGGRNSYTSSQTKKEPYQYVSAGGHQEKPLDYPSTPQNYQLTVPERLRKQMQAPVTQSVCASTVSIQDFDSPSDLSLLADKEVVTKTTFFGTPTEDKGAVVPEPPIKVPPMPLKSILKEPNVSKYTKLFDDLIPSPNRFNASLYKSASTTTTKVPQLIAPNTWIDEKLPIKSGQSGPILVVEPKSAAQFKMSRGYNYPSKIAITHARQSIFNYNNYLAAEKRTTTIVRRRNPTGGSNP